MHRHLRMALLALWAFSATAAAEPVSKEQIQGLDEQVQEIKRDVLGIAADLSRLEEKLLFPSNTQVSLFVSLAKGPKFRLDAVEIQIDGKPVAHHLYTYKELEALQNGGVQRIYTGNLTQGEHDLKVSFIGKTGSEYRQSGSFKVTKDVAPKLVGISLAGPGAGAEPISVQDW